MHSKASSPMGMDWLRVSRFIREMSLWHKISIKDDKAEFFPGIWHVDKETMRTVPVGLNSFKGQFTVRWEMLMAAAVVGMMPILIVYVLAQNWIIKGMSITGGLKG